MWTICHARYQTFVSHRKLNPFKLQATVSRNRIHPSLSISDIPTYFHRVDFNHCLYLSLSLSLSIYLYLFLPLSLFSVTLFFCLFYYAYTLMSIFDLSLSSRTLTLSNFSPCLFQCVRLSDPLFFFIFLSATALHI